MFNSTCGSGSRTDAEIINTVRKSALQPEFNSEIERVEAILRLIYWKNAAWYRKDGAAAYAVYAEFATGLGHIRFVNNSDSRNGLVSVIPFKPETFELERKFLDKNGIDLLRASGYGSFPDEGTYKKWIYVMDDKELRALAEHCVGTLHLLFEHKPGNLLEMDFYLSPPDFEDLPNAEELPKTVRTSYHTFKSRYHTAMQHYSELRASETPAPSISQSDGYRSTSTEMENVQEEFPSMIATLKKLGEPYSNFLSDVFDNQAELTECLHVLRRRFSYIAIDHLNV